MALGNRLKSRSEELGIKQTELSKRLKISRSTLNGYFTGYREPDLKTLEKLALELDTTVEYLVTGNNPHPQKALPSELSTEEALLIVSKNMLNRAPTEEELRKFLDIAKVFFDAKD